MSAAARAAAVVAGDSAAVHRIDSDRARASAARERARVAGVARQLVTAAPILYEILAVSDRVDALRAAMPAEYAGPTVGPTPATAFAMLDNLAAYLRTGWPLEVEAARAVVRAAEQ